MGHGWPSLQHAMRASGVGAQPSHTAALPADTSAVRATARSRLLKVSTRLGCWTPPQVSTTLHSEPSETRLHDRCVKPPSVGRLPGMRLANHARATPEPRPDGLSSVERARGPSQQLVAFCLWRGWKIHPRRGPASTKQVQRKRAISLRASGPKRSVRPVDSGCVTSDVAASSLP